MILLHRITPFFIGLISALGFVALLTLSVHPYVVLGPVHLLILLLLIRLVGFRPGHFSFWTFINTPFLFLVSSNFLFLFFENRPEQIGLAVCTSLLIFFFAEHLFNYLHLPGNYQAYSLEYLSLAMHVLTIFFVSATGFGLNILLQLQHIGVLILSVLFFLITLFVIYSTLWVSKVESKKTKRYALAGAVLTTELFAVLTFLPTGFYTSAAILTLFFYLFLGLMRAHFLDQLSTLVLRRYFLICVILLAIILFFSSWI